MYKNFWVTFLIVCMQVPVFAAGRQKMDLVIQQEALSSVLVKLEKASGYNFVYEPPLVRNIVITGKNFKGRDFWFILNDLLHAHRIAYSVSGANIILAAVPPPQPVQYGKISGRIVDFENADPLPGATVRLEGTAIAMVTNEKGDFLFERVPEGKYNILFSYIGYKSGRLNGLVVTANKTITASFKLQASNNLKQVEVKGIARKKVVNTTDEQLINELYTARTVISGISNEQITRSMDRDAAEVVKRIPGVNVSDDRFIVVRGLSKRYNMTFLNDNLAPATELDSRAFSFDLVSSNTIDKIMIYKSPSPDLPGEFAGGLIKINTKKSMLTRQIDVQLSAQYRPGSSFSDISSYAGSKTDFLGLDDGVRSLPKGMPSPVDFNLMGPDVNAKYSKQFANNYLTNARYFDLDKRLTINYYDSWKLGAYQLNNLSSFSYTNTHEARETEQQSLYKSNRSYEGVIRQGIHAARLSLIQNNNIQLGDHVKLELKQFINQQGQRIALNDYKVKDGFEHLDQRRVGLYFLSSFLYSGQLGSYLHFGPAERTKIFTNIGFSSIHRKDPDLRELGYSRQRDPEVSLTEDNPDAPWIHGSRDLIYPVSRYFIDVKEKAWQANADAEHRFASFFNLKAGVFHETRQRYLSTRTFRLANGVHAYDPNIIIPNEEEGGGTGAEEWQIPARLDTGIFRADGTGLRWREATVPNDQYFAENRNTAGYISLDLLALENKLNVFGGVRVEHNLFRILGSLQTGQASYPLVISKPVTSVLPSVNASYRPDSTIIIRAGYGKTLNRPEFREAAPMDYFDYIKYEHYYGNPNLSTVNIHNYDVRFEWYPRSMLRNEMFNLGFFYKTLDRPIELIWGRERTFESAFNTFYYANTGAAKVYGLEAEIRKGLAFLSGNVFRDLSLILNGAILHSEVKTPALIYYGHQAPRERPLQGQVPYLLNASLNYERPQTGTKVAIVYHRSGDQIYAIGTSEYTPGDINSGFPDIMEKGRDMLDLTWSQRVNKYLSIKAGAQNLLNAPMTLYEDYNRDYKYTPEQTSVKDGQTVNSGDVISRRYYQRPYYSLALNFIF
ncbi:TonB-dependent receptor domain-containing protein [Chitinophaga cymbidii]|uniref:TonB-dependent receptor n=1 Tax=Chitinophaga cymbidii TaxID=1096750 RepID=A0A512RFL4_9BACT|nr:TonB-dependent receptor [Chitinophaga cymbidii]GEP94434.1 TonB-dependent receptor [Chitinophaga cymbidii]